MINANNSTLSTLSQKVTLGALRSYVGQGDPALLAVRALTALMVIAPMLDNPNVRMRVRRRESDSMAEWPAARAWLRSLLFEQTRAPFQGVQFNTQDVIRRVGILPVLDFMLDIASEAKHWSLPPRSAFESPSALQVRPMSGDLSIPPLSNDLPRELCDRERIHFLIHGALLPWRARAASRLPFGGWESNERHHCVRIDRRRIGRLNGPDYSMVWRELRGHIDSVMTFADPHDLTFMRVMGAQVLSGDVAMWFHMPEHFGRWTRELLTMCVEAHPRDIPTLDVISATSPIENQAFSVYAHRVLSLTHPHEDE